MPWWKKDKLTHAGSVVFPGKLPPRAENFAYLQGMGVEIQPGDAARNTHFILELRHPKWGQAKLMCLRDMPAPPHTLIDWDRRLIEPEREAAKRGGSTVNVSLTSAEGDVLRDRKNLFRYLRAVMGTDGVVAVDHVAQAFWSPAGLDDELSHDAPLDILSLFTVHCISDNKGTYWMHSHGLKELDCFDFDLIDPHPDLSTQLGAWDLVRSLAFGVVEGKAKWNGAPYPVMGKGVRFVAAADFRDAVGRSYPRWLSSLDDGHVTGHAIVCDPASRGFLGLFSGKPRPAALFSSPIQEEMPLHFSTASSQLMAERARATWSVFRALTDEFGSLELPALVKLCYSDEHLWFKVNGPGERDVDATLVSTPWQDIGFGEGDRRRHDLERLSDWMLLTPVGSITPRSLSNARNLRTNRSKIERALAETRASGAK